MPSIWRLSAKSNCASSHPFLCVCVNFDQRMIKHFIALITLFKLAFRRSGRNNFRCRVFFFFSSREFFLLIKIAHVLSFEMVFMRKVHSASAVKLFAFWKPPDFYFIVFFSCARSISPLLSKNSDIFMK